MLPLEASLYETDKFDSIIFDQDGTLIKYPYGRWGSSWDVILHAAGKGRTYDIVAKFFHPFKGLYEKWVYAAGFLLKDVPLTSVEEKISPICYIDGVSETIPTLRRIYPKSKFGILTGGVGLIAKGIKEELNFDFYVANELEIVDGHFTGKVRCDVDLRKKDMALRKLAEKEDIDLKRTCFIADGDGDIGCLEMCGYSIAVQPKSKRVREAAKESTENFYEIQDILQRL